MSSLSEIWHHILHDHIYQFANESGDYWLPKGTTFQDLIRLSEETGILLPRLSDFWISVQIALLLAVIRFLCEHIVFTRVGRLVLSDRPNQIRARAPSKLLTFFDSIKKPSAQDFLNVSSETGLSVNYVATWFKELQEANEMQHDPKKWTETCWRCTFYTVMFVTGVIVCFNQPWIFNTDECWYNYPLVPMTVPIKYYYMTELAIYLNLLVSQFFDVKRKDFVAMFVHHIATIFLIGGSYAVNFVPIGCLVLLCHDVSDVFLESAKLMKYAGFQLMADIGFGFFAVSWLIFRLILLPFYVGWSSAFDSSKFIQPFSSWYMFHGMLLVLIILHVYWFFLILRIIYNKIVLDREVDDVREDDAAIEEALDKVF